MSVIQIPGLLQYMECMANIRIQGPGSIVLCDLPRLLLLERAPVQYTMLEQHKIHYALTLKQSRFARKKTNTPFMATMLHRVLPSFWGSSRVNNSVPITMNLPRSWKTKNCHFAKSHPNRNFSQRQRGVASLEENTKENEDKWSPKDVFTWADEKTLHNFRSSMFFLIAVFFFEIHPQLLKNCLLSCQPATIASVQNICKCLLRNLKMHQVPYVSLKQIIK